MSYLIDGCEVHVIGKIDDGFVVCRIYDHGEDMEPSLGHKEVVSEVFDEPPVERRHQQIAALEAKIAGLRKAHEELTRDEHKYSERRRKLASMPSLEMLEDAIEGRLTHYVLSGKWQSPDILPCGEAYVDQWKRDFRLLTLGYKPGTLPSWRLNQYQDGSGSDWEVIPVTSYEKAVEVLQSIIDKRIGSATSSGDTRSLEHLVSVAQKHGCAVPGDAIEKLRAAAISEARRKVESERTCLANAETALAKAEAATPMSTSNR